MLNGTESCQWNVVPSVDWLITSEIIGESKEFLEKFSSLHTYLTFKHVSYM